MTQAATGTAVRLSAQTSTNLPTMQLSSAQWLAKD
jgi:hypothetical protein